MKKSFTKLAILLVVISMLTMACGSDSKDSEKKESKKTSGSNDKKIAGSKDAEDEDNSSSSADDDNKADLVASADCSAIRDAYTEYSNAGSDEDGFDDILNVYAAIADFTRNLSALYFEQTWSDDSTYYEDELEPFIDELDAINEELDATVSAATEDTQTSAQTSELYDIVKRAATYIDESDFGPCSL